MRSHDSWQMTIYCTDCGYDYSTIVLEKIKLKLFIDK